MGGEMVGGRWLGYSVGRMSSGSTESDGTSVLSQNSIETFPEDPGVLRAGNDLEGQTSVRTQSARLSDTALYRPLQPKNRQIRVAIILPGTWREVVQCELKVLDLNDESQFSANGDSLGRSRAVVSSEQRVYDLSRGKRLSIRGILIGSIGQTVILPAMGPLKDMPERKVSSDLASPIARAVEDCRGISQLPVRTSGWLEDHTLSGEEAKFWTTLLGDQCVKKELLERHIAYRSWIRGDDEAPRSEFSLGGSIGTTNPQTGDKRSRTEPQESTDDRFNEATTYWRYQQARAFIRLDNGSLGITTVECLPGDRVYWFLGGWHPFILRERPGCEGPGAGTSDEERMQEFGLIGPCDIPDIMKRKLREEESHDVVLV